MQPQEEHLFNHKRFYFVSQLVTAEYIDSLEDFEIRDSDVFLVTYPKSGTTWTQNILSLIYHDGHRNGTEDIDLIDRVPWLEYNINNMDYTSRPSPRLFASHLPYYLVPKGLRNKRGKLVESVRSGSARASIDSLSNFFDAGPLVKGIPKQVIYVSRNPKDVLVSYYHFSKIALTLETVEDFDNVMEKFLAGKVLASLWLDHVEGWYTHKDDFNILFLSYEEMKKDLRSSVLKICNFLGKELTEEELHVVVDKASFDKQRKDPRANYENLPADIIEKGKGHFLRKGTVGDWKNTMTVAQSERFDSVFKERMQKLPFRICWDINEELPS